MKRIVLISLLVFALKNIHGQEDNKFIVNDENNGIEMVLYGTWEDASSKERTIIENKQGRGKVIIT
jgi:hypothetical protein